MKNIISIFVVYDDGIARLFDAKMLLPQKNDILTITGAPEDVVEVAIQLKKLGLSTPIILLDRNIRFEDIKLIHENKMEKLGWCRRDVMEDQVNRLKVELRKCVDWLNGVCTYPDGHNVDTTNAHALLGDFEKEGS